jgi:hypothetical protein
MSDKYSIVILNKKLHQRVAFDCGEPALNDYLQKFAVQHAAQDIVIFLHFCTRGPRDNTPRRGVIPWLVKLIEGQIGKNITILMVMNGQSRVGKVFCAHHL